MRHRDEARARTGRRRASTTRAEPKRSAIMPANGCVAPHVRFCTAIASANDLAAPADLASRPAAGTGRSRGGCPSTSDRMTPLATRTTAGCANRRASGMVMDAQSSVRAARPPEPGCSDSTTSSSRDQRIDARLRRACARPHAARRASRAAPIERCLAGARQRDFARARVACLARCARVPARRAARGCATAPCGRAARRRRDR